MRTGRGHWETVYSERDDAQLSWFEPDPALSLRFVIDACSDRST